MRLHVHRGHRLRRHAHRCGLSRIDNRTSCWRLHWLLHKQWFADLRSARTSTWHALHLAARHALHLATRHALHLTARHRAHRHASTGVHSLLTGHGCTGSSGAEGEFLEKLFDRGLAFVAVFFEAAKDRGTHLRRDVRTDRSRFERKRLLRQVLRSPSPRCVGFEGQTPCKHLVGHDSERIDVAAIVELLATKLLGAHVRRSSENRALLREFLLFRIGSLGAFGDAEVEHFDVVLFACAFRQEDVRGFEIAMHDAFVVRFLE